MSMALAPCSWDPIPCGCDLPGYGEEDSGEDSGAELDPSVQYAVETAQFVLWALSGRQFGCCELSFRPCRRDCWSGTSGAWGARLVDGSWINLPCRSCSGACACSEVNEVKLPNGPACEVTEVILDGEALDPSLYRLEDSEWVVLDPSAGRLPYCQDLSRPLGEEGTYGITYTYGTPPPVAGRRAVGQLACEILRACANDNGCKLPARVQSFTRQGFNAVLIDPFEFLTRGRTGLYEIDLFLSAVNPLGRPSGARVMSPDSEPRARGGY
jgi:hypothetical protein